MILINLLPGAAKRKKRQELFKMLSITFSLFALTVLALGIAISIVFSQKIATQNSIDTVRKQIDQKQAEISSYANIIGETSLLNAKLTAINEILSKNNRWSSFLTDLAGSTPSSGVKLVSVTAGDDLKLTVSGIADSAEVLAKALATMRKATETTQYTPRTTDSIGSISAAFKTTPDLIFQANEVTTQEDLLQLKSIIIPQLLFDSVEISSVSLQNDDQSAKEVERNVSFALSIVLKDNAIR